MRKCEHEQRCRCVKMKMSRDVDVRTVKMWQRCRCAVVNVDVKM